MLSVNLAVTARASQKSILITEVQTGTEVSASQEFVEIYNDSSTQVDISGWSMYYKSATGNTWIKKATILTKILNPGEFFVFNSGLLGDISFSSTFSESGGNIQIRNNLGVAVDQFAWGSGNSALGKSASESSAGQSMYRIFDFENKKMQTRLQPIPFPRIVFPSYYWHSDEKKFLAILQCNLCKQHFHLYIIVHRKQSIWKGKKYLKHRKCTF